MTTRTVLHMLSPRPQVSPFDINMAVDAGFDMIFPHANVAPDQVYGLTQDIIFSRVPKGVKETAIFIGGRDIGIALDMMETVKKAMVPPFEVSVLADPSGAFTTATALVASVEKQLKEKHDLEMQDCRAVVFGGTGPVGISTGVIASLAGADVTLVDHLSLDTAMQTAAEYSRRCGCHLKGTFSSSGASKSWLVNRADIIFNTTKAGIQVLDKEMLEDTTRLKVVGDVNAVPPAGVEGVKAKDMGAPLPTTPNSPGAVSVGPLAVGGIKYKLQNAMLRDLLRTEEHVYFDFREAFTRARRLV
ncbi:MAG: NAD(P)-dependent methylenetetrahydromethanopterin dehydrogenase [Methylohalobius sp. ZOD2]